MRAAAQQVANLRKTAPAAPTVQVQGTAARPLIRRVAFGASYAATSKEAAAAAAPPPGKMVRAPATLRITRTPTGPLSGPSGPRTGSLTGAPRTGGFTRRPRPTGDAAGPGSRPDGPNLRGRRGPGSKGPGGAGPKMRGKNARAQGAKREGEEDGLEKVEDTLSDGMVMQMMRLQRKMWDRKAYEPIYAPGSKAAIGLLEEGKKLFEGEVRFDKKAEGRKWTKLERRIGVVGMHGA